MNLIINPSQPPGYTRPINNGSTRFALPIPGRSRLKPELEKTLFLSALAQIGVAGCNLARGACDAQAAFPHSANRFYQARVHVRERAQQQAGFIGLRDHDPATKISPLYRACHLDSAPDRHGDRTRDEVAAG